MKAREAELRRELWEDLRSLQVACEAVSSDPRAAAKALSLYVMLPENSEPAIRRELAFRVEQRLRSEADSAPELVQVLDFSSGVLAALGEYEEATRYAEESLERRAELFGRTGEDYAQGLLYLAHTYGNWAKAADQAIHRQRAIATGNEAVRTLWETRGGNDRASQEMLMQFRALLEELRVEPSEADRLTSPYSASSSKSPQSE